MLALTVGSILSLTGCTRSGAAGEKWLDCGTEVINVNRVTLIRVSVPGEVSFVNFDNFRFSFRNQADADAVFNRIKQFIAGNDTYLKLELPAHL